MPGKRTGPALRFSTDSFSKNLRAARDRSDTTRSYCATGRPRATAHRRTRRAAPRSGRQLERVRARLVHQQPPFRLQGKSAGRMREAADAVRGDDAVARNYDWQAVVAAGLAHRAAGFPLVAAK